MFKVGDVIDCVITEIDKEKRRVAISHRLTKENPYETLEKKYPNRDKDSKQAADYKKEHEKIIPAEDSEPDKEKKSAPDPSRSEKARKAENWHKGNKDQLLFERLTKKWTK